MTEHKQPGDRATDVRRGRVSGGGPNPWSPEEVREMIQQFSGLPDGAEETAEGPQKVPHSASSQPQLHSPAEHPPAKAVPAESEEGSVEIPRKVLQETLQRFAKSGESLREDMYLRAKLSRYESSSASERSMPEAGQELKDASANR
jgi:hypothetical protein